MGYKQKCGECLLISCLAFPTLGCSGRQQESLPIAEVRKQTFELPIGTENALPEEICISEVPQVYFLEQSNQKTTCPDGRPLSVEVDINNGIGFYTVKIPKPPVGCSMAIEGSIRATAKGIQLPTFKLNQLLK